jgi:hypothetical protein
MGIGYRTPLGTVFWKWGGVTSFGIFQAPPLAGGLEIFLFKSKWGGGGGPTEETHGDQAGGEGLMPLRACQAPSGV